MCRYHNATWDSPGYTEECKYAKIGESIEDDMSGIAEALNQVMFEVYGEGPLSQDRLDQAVGAMYDIIKEYTSKLEKFPLGLPTIQRHASSEKMADVAYAINQ